MSIYRHGDDSDFNDIIVLSDSEVSVVVSDSDDSVVVISDGQSIHCPTTNSSQQLE